MKANLPWQVKATISTVAGRNHNLVLL